MATGLPNMTATSINVTSTSSLKPAIAAHNLIISLIPYTLHAAVIKAVIKGRTHVITTSYVNDAMRALDKEAKDAGIILLNEIGLDLGIDHLYAIKTIGEVHDKGRKVGCCSFSISYYLILAVDQAILKLLWWSPCTQMYKQPSWIQIFLVLPWSPPHPPEQHTILHGRSTGSSQWQRTHVSCQSILHLSHIRIHRVSQSRFHTVQGVV